MLNRSCYKKKKKKHLCFRLASHAELMLTSSSHAPETFPSKEPQQTPNCFCCFQSHQNILPSLEMSTIPACATATGEGGLERVFFLALSLDLLTLITWRTEWNLEATLFSRLHFSITGAGATCRFLQREFGNAVRLRTGVTSFPLWIPP